MSESSSATISSSSWSLSSNLITTHEGPTSGRGRPCEVVVTTGHPNPGNAFDIEMADIRHLVALRSRTVVAVPCAELADVPRHLDEHRPRILHVGAHAQHGGVRWTLEREAHVVTWASLLDAVRRATHRPAGAVFNVCHSMDAARLVDDGVGWAVTCAGDVKEDAARLFTRTLYTNLGHHPVGPSFAEAEAAMASATRRRRRCTG